MESDKSLKDEEQDNKYKLNSSFLNYRSKNSSEFIDKTKINERHQKDYSSHEDNFLIEGNISITGVNFDSGYNSSLSNYTNSSVFTPINTPCSLSINKTEATTPQKSSLFSTLFLSSDNTHNNDKNNSHNFSSNNITTNLITIPESPKTSNNLEELNSNKLTPVTQNLRKIFNIHITTPKSQNKLSSSFIDKIKEEKSEIINTQEKIEKTEIKNDSFQKFTIKRRKISEFNEENLHKTPKKTKLDVMDDFNESFKPLTETKKSCKTSLRRSEKILKKRKKNFGQKLHSAPDLDLNFFNYNFENIENINNDYRTFNLQLTPVRSAFFIQQNEKRTPLSSTSLNLIPASTPKSIDKYLDDVFNRTNTTRTPLKESTHPEASVKELLAFSDKQFEDLLNSPKEKDREITKFLKHTEKPIITASNDSSLVFNTDEKYLEDNFREYKTKQSIISSHKPLSTPFASAPKAGKEPFKRTLKFSHECESSSNVKSNSQDLPLTALDSSNKIKKLSEKTTDNSLLYYEEQFNDYKTLYPMVNKILTDRRVEKNRLSSNARFIDIKRESNKLIRTKSSRRLSRASKQNKHKNKKPKGFQKILGYVPTSFDLKISDIDDNNRNLSDRGEIDMEISPNLNLVKSKTGKILNKSFDEIEKNEELVNKVLEFTNSEPIDIEIEENGNNISCDENKNEEIEESSGHYLKSLKFTPPKSNTAYENIFKINFSESQTKFLPTTPKKLKTFSSRSSIDYEKNEILYPTIPRTPSKKSPIKQKYFLSNSTCSSDLLQSSVVPLKRKIFNVKDTDKRLRIYYDGFSHLNIIAKLESYDLVLERIFELLSSQDLLNLALSSKKLQTVVLSNQKAKKRISKYLSDSQKAKENDTLKNFDKKLLNRQRSLGNEGLKLDLISSTKKSNGKTNRAPFKRCNSIHDYQYQYTSVNALKTNVSPPVSPSTRKFHENQKVVKLLNENEKLVKCPRCLKSSRIINIKPLTLSPKFYTSINPNNNNYQQNQQDCLYYSKDIKSNKSQLTNIYETKQQAFQSSSTSTSSNINNNRNNDRCNYKFSNNNFVPNSLSLSQPSSNTFKSISMSTSTSSSLPINFVPQFSLCKTKKFIKSMSVDSVNSSKSLYHQQLPRTPTKKQQSVDGNLLINNNNSIKPDSPSKINNKYGECTGIHCKFRFCLDCLCEYHPNSQCKIVINNSPSKEDIQNCILQLTNNNNNQMNDINYNLNYVGSKAVTLTKTETETATATTTSVVSSGISVAPSTSTSTNSRALKIRRKSLKRLCF